MKRIMTQRGALLGLFLLLAAGCSSRENSVETAVTVDFGPADRAALKKTVAVPERSTVFEALRTAFPVVTSGR
jgi:hypothetical protein